MSDETYNGWKNRETWAFWLHVTNDQGWYEMVREFTAAHIEKDRRPNDHVLGSNVVEYVKDTLEEFQQVATHANNTDGWRELRMMRDEIGSWRRIDSQEIGRAARELVEDES